MSELFHKRFNISVDIEGAKKRFVNRVQNIAFGQLLYKLEKEPNELKRLVVFAIGEKWISSSTSLERYVGDEFYRNLQALEALYHAAYKRVFIGSFIEEVLSASEVDLGLRWEKGRFFPSGAKLLDEKLVNENLHWLEEQEGYESVLEPFQKGLNHFLYSENRPELLTDVITDMYEAVEALAKIVTGRKNKDLSENRELFVSRVKASKEYKELLKNYISYANNFRHAATEEKPKPTPSRKEVESFFYLTGLFIRLAMP